MVKPYKPCEVDGKPCQWTCDEWAEDGEYKCSESYCAKCYRWQDCDEEMPEEADDSASS